MSTAAEVRRASVLIVEDEEMKALALRMMVGHKYDYHIEQARTMAEAREAMEACPDIVLLDIKLPDGMGYDMIDEIRSRCRKAKIVVVTGAPRESDRALAAIAKKPDGILFKPYTKEELWAAVAPPEPAGC